MSKINYHTINSCLINDKYLFFDIFARLGELVLICPIYAKYLIENLNIFINENILTDKHMIVYDEYEPIIIVKYNISHIESSIINVDIRINDKKYFYELYNAILDNGFLMCGTLLKQDYRDICFYKDYYAKQGCDFFVLYYNGLADESLIDQYANDETIWINWDFPYWIDPEIYGYKHHAQIGQINHMLYKYGKPFYKWMISCDLDEYIHIKDTSLKSFLQKISENKCLKFENYWAHVVNKSELKSIYNIDIQKNIKSDGKFVRTKIIANTKIVEAMGIHHTKKLTNNNYVHEYTPDNSFMLHMSDWSKPYRKAVDIEYSHNIQLKLYE